MASEKVKPIILNDEDNHCEYTLEFTRESIRFAESRGFKLEDVGDFLMLKLPELWFYAFRAHHKRVARAETDRLLDELCEGGIPDGLIERLGALYAVPYETLIGGDDEGGAEKNARVTATF